MYDAHQVIEGLTRFVDHELVPKMHGLNRWLFGTGAGIVASKGEKVFELIKDNDILKALDLIDGTKINVSCLYKELSKQAEHGHIDIEIPMIGTLKLDKTDVDKMYRYIIED